MIVVFLVDYIWFSIHNFIDENGSNNSATSYLIFIFFHLLYLGTFFYFSLISTYVVLLTMFFSFCLSIFELLCCVLLNRYRTLRLKKTSLLNSSLILISFR
jgi:hypothetical protein